MIVKANLKRFQKFLVFVLMIAIPILNFPIYSYADAGTSVMGKVLKPISKKIKNIKSKWEKPAIRATGGSSAALRQNLGTKPNYAAHHIIPVELKNHRVLNKIGMDMDDVNNGISLPRYPGVDPKLPLHRGSHPDYTNAVKKKLDEIPDNLSVEETKKRVLEIQRQFRNELDNGAPLHTSQGGIW